MKTDFFEQYFSVLRMALASGWQAKPLVASRVNDETISRSEVKEFLAACHRGYEKAQNRIVEMVCELSADQSLNETEKFFAFCFSAKSRTQSRPPFSATESIICVAFCSTTKHLQSMFRC